MRDDGHGRSPTMSKRLLVPTAEDDADPEQIASIMDRFEMLKHAISDAQVAAVAIPIKPPEKAVSKKRAIPMAVPPCMYPNPRLYIGYTRGKLLLTLMASLGCLNQKVTLDFDETGLWVRQVEANGGILMVYLHVPKSIFDVYTMRARSISYSIQFEQLKGVVRAFKAHDVFTFTETPAYPDSLLIRAHSEHSDSTRIMTVDENNNNVPIIDCTKFSHPIKVTLSTNAFGALVNNCKANGGLFVEFSIQKNPERFCCTALADSNTKSQTFTESVTVANICVTGEGTPQCFAVEFLHMISSFSETAQYMTLHFGNGPMYCTFNVLEEEDFDRTTLEFVLCPRDLDDDE